MNKKFKKFVAILLILVFGCLNYTEKVFAEKQSITVFNRSSNVWNSRYFRIPSLQILDDGTLLAFSDIRYNGSQDHAYIDIGLARSTDNGETWDYKVVMENDRVNSTYSRVMDSTTVVTNTGRIILIAGSWNTNGNWASSGTGLRQDWSVQMVYSDDNGQTWSNKIDLTTNKARIKNQPSNTIGWLGGVGSGIVMSDGTIVLPIQIALRENNANRYYSSIIYSRDNGETWTMGNKVPHAKTSENMVIELDGNLIMSARYDSSGYRASYISRDLGNTWEVYEPLHGKILAGTGSGCQGSFIKVTALNGHRIGLISAPKRLENGHPRDNVSLYMIDFDNLSKGVKEIAVPYPYSGNNAGVGYSSLSFNNNTLGIVYEANGNIDYKDLRSVYLSINNENTDKARIDYLSDIEWKNQSTSHGKIGRDIAHDGATQLALKLNDDTIINYNKGVGIHSIGEITVNLTNKGYTKFETSVGVLQGSSSAAKNNSSVQYQFYLDDVLVKETGVMRYNTPKEDISLNLTGKSTLKIVVNDGGNGNSGDWGVLADARFTYIPTVYLSDIEWKSQSTSHGTIGRDIAHDGVSRLSLRSNTDTTINYNKGVGIHSIGEIEVDLRNKLYNKFETSVGVLQGSSSAAKNNSSVQYKFYLDDVLVKETGIMRYNTPKEDISLDLTGKSTLKIVVNDGGNGNSGDWGVLADAHFTYMPTAYLSDIEWKSQSTSHGTIGRDVAHDGVNQLSLRENNGNTINYNKGVGIHSVGKIEVDLSNNIYKNFKVSVGVLQTSSSTSKDKSSVQYQFYLDDVLVKQTATMGYTTPKEDISLDLTGKSTLKIVVNDGGNGNAGDWGVLGDARFTID